jgi:hypothetical protein
VTDESSPRVEIGWDARVTASLAGEADPEITAAFRASAYSRGAG